MILQERSAEKELFLLTVLPKFKKKKNLKTKNFFIKTSNPTEKRQFDFLVMIFDMKRLLCLRSSIALGVRIGQFQLQLLPVWPGANDFTSPLEVKNSN